jgi:murein DD-endopeptidase MepM/ murein hydrolase activator NlpD
VRDRIDPLARVTGPGSLGLVLGLVAALLVLVTSSPGQPTASLAGAGALSPAQGGSALAGDASAAPEDRGLWYSVYRVAKGDTVGDIASREGISVDAIVSFNDIQNTRNLREGQLLKVPSQAGILHKAKSGDTASSVAASYEISADAIIEANGLLAEELPAGKIVFLPDARIPSFTLREINGDLFRWPVRGWITSRFGWREDPFTGTRSYHSGLDIGSGRGTPVLAAMEGRVSATGYSATLGNYVLVAHHSGWQSFYGHLDSILARPGQSVGLGTKIGLVGNTGYSTGPHLHFSVYKYGRLVNPAGVLR